MFYTTELSILILMVMILMSVSLLVSTIIYLFLINPLKKKLNEQLQIMHLLFKRNGLNNDKLYDISNENSEIKENITSLSTSIDTLLKDLQKSNDKKIFPTPELAKMIDSTIREQIAIETALSHNMKIAKKSSVTNIVTVVTMTYPFVDEEYITKKCLSIIESSIKNE